MKSTKKSIIGYLLTLIITALILVFVYRLWEVNIFETPFIYSGDAITGLTETKIMIEKGGVGWQTERMGAPFGYNITDGNQSIYLYPLLKKAVTFFSSNWIFVTNFSYLAGFIIIALISLFVLKKLGIEEKIAVVMAILYACTPYHFMRGESHASLAFYVPAPIAVYYILCMMRGNVLKSENHFLNWNNVKYFMAMIVIGTGGVYYAFFSCFFLCVAGSYILINEKKLERLKEILLSIILISGTVVTGYLPTLIYAWIHGKNNSGIVRSAEAMEIYGLKLSQLIMPITGHRISFLAELKNKFNHLYTVNENDTASLGLVFSIGFLILLFYLWKNREKKVPYICELTCLNIAALIYASAGGLVLIQGLFFAMIRCGNRISIFIAFFSCVCLGILFTNFVKKRNISQRMVIILLTGLLTLGILDNTQVKYFDVEAMNSIVENDRSFIKAIGKSEAESGMILQLPIMRFPESGPINNMLDYAPMIGYLYSDKLQWSYGVFGGREGDDLFTIFEQEDLSATDMVQIAAQMGYSGIYIDGNGYGDKEYMSLTEALKSVTNQEPIESTMKDKTYFSLKDYIKKNDVKKDYCSVIFQNGVYGLEGAENNCWRWVEQQSRFGIYNWSEKEQEVSLEICISPSWTEGHYSLTVKSDKAEENFVLDLKENIFLMKVNLSPGYNWFEMNTDAPLLTGTNDPRNLCFRLSELRVLKDK